MMHCAFKLDETISKQIYFWGGKKNLRILKKRDPVERKAESLFFSPRSENGTKPPAESQLT